MNLSNQIIENISDVYNVDDFNFEIDYSKARELVALKRAQALEWLKNAMEASLTKPDKTDLLYDYLMSKNYENQNALSKGNFMYAKSKLENSTEDFLAKLSDFVLILKMKLKLFIPFILTLLSERLLLIF